MSDISKAMNLLLYSMKVNGDAALKLADNYEKMLEFIKKDIAGSTCTNNENLRFYIGDTVIDNAKELLKEMGITDE